MSKESLIPNISYKVLFLFTEIEYKGISTINRKNLKVETLVVVLKCHFLRIFIDP